MTLSPLRLHNRLLMATARGAAKSGMEGTWRLGMPFRLIIPFLTVVVMAIGVLPAMADVDVQLNLQYTNPADESAGGTWDLLVKTDSTFGVAGLSVVVTGDLGVTSVNSPAAQVVPNVDAFEGADSIFYYNLGVSGTEIVAGHNLTISPFVTGVGTPGSAANVAEDDLFNDGIPDNNPWDNSSLIASGTLEPGSARPTFAFIEANEYTSLTTVSSTAATLGNTSVRGDGVATDGLIQGDANRNGIVDVSDLGIMATNWQQSPRDWDTGNFNATSDSIVDVSDLGILATNWQVATSPSPVPLTVSTVPEPTTPILGVLGTLLLFSRRRR